MSSKNGNRMFMTFGVGILIMASIFLYMGNEEVLVW